MSKDFPHEKWVKSNSNSSSSQVQVEQEEEEEALSLCDLPINKANQSPKEQVQPTQAHAEFDFGFGSGSSSGLGQMCAADEVFFRGQILPFRHSVSSESSLSGLLNPTRSMSRSESMDHSYSGGFRSIPNSRSSSIKSQYSSSSGSSTGYKPRVRNQFHSHPSPSPQIRSQSTRQGNSGHRNPKSTIWGFFQTGLVRAPEIGLWSIGGNNNINKSFGSRNSNSSSCSSVSNGKKIEIKKKLRLFDINGALFGGCKCSVLNAVEVVPSKIVILKEEEKEVEVEEEEEEREKKKEGKQKRKQAVSRNRTFEWLKQLSLEGTADGA